MRKVLAAAIAVLFVFSTATVITGMNCMDHGKTEGDHGKTEVKKGCDMGKDGDCIMSLDAEYSVKDTKDGAVITIKAKKDGADVKTIREKAKKCVEMCAAHKGEKAAASDEKVKCPVMGVELAKGKVYESIEYEGKTYSFCCAGCKEKFLADPKKYIEK